MTLRARLVVALVTMLTVGLAIFGVVVTSFYARTQYQRLDERLRDAAPLASARLRAELDLPVGRLGGPGGRGGGPAALLSTTDAYVEVRDADGVVLGSGRFSESDATPDIPAGLASTRRDERFRTVGPATGTGNWRARASYDPRTGTVDIVAVPISEVAGPIRRLIVIELLAAGSLLVALGAGAWLIMRHGLRPLEQMATSASAITAGNLDQRVSPADSQTEVGQLGLAINTMLAEIEDAFRARDATEQRLRQFLADASHELRTPLTSIRGFAELFRLGAADDREQLATVLRRIEEESARMKVLVEELLLLARLDQTRPLRREAVDLAVLAADACTDATAVAPDRPVVLDAPAPVVVHGDRDHLRQAIANLVTNAIAHTPPGTRLDVGTRVEGDEAVVAVRDHGPGLDPAALEHAFDRFWQADAARVGTGTGLGLAIVAAIVAEHDGTVTAANADDGGARLTIRLPLSALEG